MRNEIDDSAFETLRGINRKHSHEIWKEALLLIEHALTLAKGLFEEGTLDQEILDEMEEKKREILDRR